MMVPTKKKNDCRSSSHPCRGHPLAERSGQAGVHTHGMPSSLATLRRDSNATPADVRRTSAEARKHARCPTRILVRGHNLSPSPTRCVGSRTTFAIPLDNPWAHLHTGEIVSVPTGRACRREARGCPPSGLMCRLSYSRCRAQTLVTITSLTAWEGGPRISSDREMKTSSVSRRNHASVRQDRTPPGDSAPGHIQTCR